MSLPLEEQEIQTLCHKFGLPDLVKNWLSEPKSFQTANEYILHEDLCNLHPEDAVLCIALCMKMILRNLAPPHKTLTHLDPLINNIINTYGHEALNRQGQPIANDERMNIEYVAKDLTELSYRLNTLSPDNFSYQLNVILSALNIQANAQAEIARYVLAHFREQEEKSKAQFTPDSIQFLKTLPVNDNRHH